MGRVFTQILVCIGLTGGLLYTYVDRQNEITKLRLAIPQVAKAVKEIQEKNTRLQYQIDQFESPEHLMRLALRAEFAHLRYPTYKEVLTLNQGQVLPLIVGGSAELIAVQNKSSPVIGYID